MFLKGYCNLYNKVISEITAGSLDLFAVPLSVFNFLI